MLHILSSIKFLITPLAFVIYFTLFSGLIILPTPWQRQQLFFTGHIGEVNFNEEIKFRKPLGIFINSFNFPSKLGFYDFYLNFMGTPSSPLGDASTLRFSIKKNTQFWSYISEELGKPDEKLSSEVVGTYVLGVGDKIKVEGIPIGVPIEYSSGFIECGLSKDGPCPDFFSQNVFEGVDSYVKPNQLSLLMQWVLIFAFWAVVINSFVDLINKKWKSTEGFSFRS